MNFDKILKDLNLGLYFRNYFQEQINLYKNKPDKKLESRMKKLVRIFEFNNKVTHYNGTVGRDKYNLWETAFNTVFIRGKKPKITDNDFDKRVNAIIDMETRLSRFKKGIKAIGKSIVSRIPLRL